MPIMIAIIRVATRISKEAFKKPEIILVLRSLEWLVIPIAAKIPLPPKAKECSICWPFRSGISGENTHLDTHIEAKMPKTLIPTDRKVQKSRTNCKHQK